MSLSNIARALLLLAVAYVGSRVAKRAWLRLESQVRDTLP
jgi:hypothetical protein